MRADIHRWHLWEAAHWFPSCYVYLVENVVKPLLKAEPDRAVTDKEAPNWHRLASILDERLADQRWLCGDRVTLADIAVAAPMHLHPYQKLPLERAPQPAPLDDRRRRAAAVLEGHRRGGAPGSQSGVSAASAGRRTRAGGSARRSDLRGSYPHATRNGPRDLQLHARRRLGPGSLLLRAPARHGPPPAGQRSARDGDQRRLVPRRPASRSTARASR